jgi:hypothetical protein
MGANLQYHEAANIFPMMEDKAFDAMRNNIEAHGVLVPIELFEGKILDGRNRYLACLQLRIECPSIEWNGDDPVSYVVSKNQHRRHMTPSQLALIGAKARDVYDKLAKERQKAGGAAGGKATHGKVPVTVPEPSRSDSRDAAGKAVGVSGSLVDRGTKVLRKGEPELVKAVEEGRMSVTTAAAFADEDPESQKEAAALSTNSGGRFRGPKPPKGGSVGKPSGGQQATEAMQFATIAISQLERIRDNDPKRDKALEKVETWIIKHRE